MRLCRSKAYAILLFLMVISAGHQAFSQVLEQTFSDSDAHFKISTPDAHWNFGPRERDEKTFKLLMRYESPVDNFIPNVTVQVQTAPEDGKDLKSWVEKDLENLPKGIELTQKKKISHRDLVGYEVTLRQREMGVLFQQWFFLAKGHHFVLTCTAKETSFGRMGKDFEKILNSFEII